MNNNNNNSNNSNIRFELDFFRILNALWKKLWVILIALVIGGGLGFSFARFYVTPKYQSTAKLYVNNTGMDIGEIFSKTVDVSAMSGAARLVDTYVNIMKSRPTMEAVIEELNLPYSPGVLSGMVSAATIENTALFTVTVTSTNAEEAALIVNTIARVLPNKLSEVIDGSSGSSVRVVESGLVNSGKISPDVAKYTAIGMLAGALLAAAVIILLDMMDNVIHDESFINQLPVEIPLLSAIPDLSFSGGQKYAYRDYKKNNDKYAYGAYSNKYNKEAQQASKKKKTDDTSRKNIPLCGELSFAGAEAYKLLRANLQFAFPNQDAEECKVIGITSSVRGEGKSTTAINLAYSMAQSGKKTLLIEADMRLPNIIKRLNLEQKDTGLSRVLVMASKFTDAVHTYRSIPHWHILGAGPIPPNPSELLGSSRMRTLIEECKSYYAYIIIDLPPVDAVSDALVISSFTDGYILVCRENYSVLPQITEAVNQLEFSDSQILGCVLNCSYTATKSKYSKRYRRRYGYNKYRKNYGYRRGYGYGRGYGKGYGYGYGYGYDRGYHAAVYPPSEGADMPPRTRSEQKE